MEQQQLEYFQTVARMEHMTRAAQLLSISQSALSRSISRLEEELRVPLFDRLGRSITLNRYGKLFLKRVQNMLKEYEEAKLEIQNALDIETGEITVGFLHTLGSHLIPDLIGAFRAESPKIRFQLNQSNTSSLVQQLIQGSIDLCLLSSPNDTNTLEWKELWSEELFVFVPTHHRFADRESISLKEIADEPMISLKTAMGFGKSLTSFAWKPASLPELPLRARRFPPWRVWLLPD